MNRKVSAGLAVGVLAFTLASPRATFAATTPSLGAAASYAILADTYTNTSAATTVNGDIGFSTGPATAPLGSHPNYGSGAPYATAGANAASALSPGLSSQACTHTFPDTDIDLAADVSHGPIGVYTPGVYCGQATRAGSIGTAGITLSGAGTYIFRFDGALTSVDDSDVVLAGASACDVFWTNTAATTLGANTTFSGTVLQTSSAITVGANTVWTGRALAFGGTVATGSASTITTPTCTQTPVPGGPQQATVTVVKNVINDNGGTKTLADFSLFVGNTQVASGVTNVFPPVGGVYTVTETNDPNYTRTFSGDCDANGQFNLTQGQNKVCIVTNNDIGAPVVVPPVPPLIDVVKVPSPLSLPGGPGPVTYTYTLRNIGTVPVTGITMVGDTCSPIVRVSGDVDGDNQLDLAETWVHTCSTTLSQTHTNTVVATGWANGLSTSDIASATVVVGSPVVPPLIHVTKIPSTLTLLAGGGMVTYSESITNPGTVPLSSVGLNDDKCAMNFVSGDVNNDAKLDPSETWKYTCTTNVAMTTTNIATASGEANGIIVRDFALATVVVAAAVPPLPKTGFEPMASAVVPGLIAAIVGAAAIALYASRKRLS